MARAFLDTLRSPGTLFLQGSDAEPGVPRPRGTGRLRGRSLVVGAASVAGSAPDSDLVAYLRTLGLGPSRVFVPGRVSGDAPLARLVLEDEALVARLHADPDLARVFVGFKDAHAARLLERLARPPAWCAPPAQAYEAANDKLALVEAAERFGFDAVPFVPVDDAADVGDAFDRLSRRYGEGCVVRVRRGASGVGVHRARTRRAAVRAWQRLRNEHPGRGRFDDDAAEAVGPVLLAPFVPPGRVLRNVATHGIATGGRIAPLVFAEQITDGAEFRGGRVEAAWAAAEVAAIRRTLDGVARWLGSIGFMDAPAGVDGFLVREDDGPRFLALDPNMRLTATMVPWAVAATLAEAAGRPFAWQFETWSTFGAALTFRRLTRRLGDDLFSPTHPSRGGIAPILVAPARLGVGRSVVMAVLLATDAARLGLLAARMRRLRFSLP